MVVDDASSCSGDESGEQGDDLHLAPAEEATSEGDDGLGHHGDTDTEVEVVEDSGGDGEGRQKVLRVPMTHTEAEVDAHLATHLPHADWCELCMKGRGRNTPHRRRNLEHPN